MDDYLNLKDIQYVMAIAEFNSISKAAETVYVTQPALSSYINKLEERLSIKLFERIGKKFVPTYAGEQVVEYGKKIMALESELKYKLDDIANNIDERIRIGCVQHAFLFLPQVLKRFQDTHPNVKTTIIESSPSEIKRLLLMGELDFAFGSNAMKDDNLDYKIIRKNYICIYAAEGSEIDKKSYVDSRYNLPVINITDCSYHTLFVNNALPLLVKITEDTFKELKYEHSSEKIMYTQSELTNIYMAALDLGFCISTENVINGISLSRNPKAFLIKGLEDKYTEFVALTRKGGFNSKAIQDIFTFTQNHYLDKKS